MATVTKFLIYQTTCFAVNRLSALIYVFYRNTEDVPKFVVYKLMIIIFYVVSNNFQSLLFICFVRASYNLAVCSILVYLQVYYLGWV